MSASAAFKCHNFRRISSEILSFRSALLTCPVRHATSDIKLCRERKLCETIMFDTVCSMLDIFLHSPVFLRIARCLEDINSNTLFSIFLALIFYSQVRYS